ARIRRAVGAGRRVDTGDPQPAEIALLALSADVRVLPGLVNDLVGDGEEARSSAPEALGMVENAIAAPSRLETSFGSRHGRGSLSAVRQHDLDALLERLGHHVVVAQSTQALAGFLLHTVVAAAFRSPDTPGAR